MSQYYIAKIRYQNPLPPPPFPPKLLNISHDITPFTKTAFTQTLSQQQPQNVELDLEGGIPLDLCIHPGIFEGDFSAIYGHPSATLDPKDQALLKDPIQHGRSARTQVQAAVAPFLRRTEYIASEKPSSHVFTSPMTTPRRASTIKEEEFTREMLENPELHVRAIEGTFQAIERTVAKGMKHPRKPGVVCEDAWEVFPELENAGMSHLIVRFNDDNIVHHKDNLEEEADLLDVAIVRPLQTDSPEEILGYFLPSSSHVARAIKAVTTSLSDNSTNLDDGDVSENFIYTHLRDYEADVKVNSNTYEEVALYFSSGDENSRSTQGKGAYYIPVDAKSTLKRRRAPPIGQAWRREQEVKVVELDVRYRGLNVSEITAKKRARLELKNGKHTSSGEEDGSEEDE